jgi:hypothetical protein
MIATRLSMIAAGAACLLLAGSVGEHVPDPAASAITSAGLLAHIKVLASDEFGGRGPGTPEEAKTVAYLIAQCKKMGLKPGNPDGSYIQKVTLWGIRSTGSMTITGVEPDMALTARQDYTVTSQQPQAEISIDPSAMVFVGYGVVAPKWHWDDYKDVDVKGKTVVVLSGDPPVPDPNDPAKLDENMFLGKALSVYGRPVTKYETAYSRGAVAVVSLFAPRAGAANLARAAQNTPRETMILRDESATKRIPIQGQLSMEKARLLFQANGQDLDALMKAAIKSDFRAVPLSAKAAFKVENTLREVDSSNVIAKIPGSDAKLKSEYVIYTGHRWRPGLSRRERQCRWNCRCPGTGAGLYEGSSCAQANHDFHVANCRGEGTVGREVLCSASALSPDCHGRQHQSRLLQQLGLGTYA